jgi:hypothetical protein
MPNYEDLISLVRGPAPHKAHTGDLELRAVPLWGHWSVSPTIHRFYFDVDYKLANQIKLAELIPDAFLLPGFFADLGVVVDASAFGGELLWLEGTALPISTLQSMTSSRSIKLGRPSRDSPA